MHALVLQGTCLCSAAVVSLYKVKHRALANSSNCIQTHISTCIITNTTSMITTVTIDANVTNTPPIRAG